MRMAAQFATAGADKIVRIYSPNGKLLHSLEGSTAPITSLVFLPDNKLVSAGGDKLLRLWDAKTGKPLGEWPGHSAAILSLAATPDGRVVVSGSADKTVNGWNAATGKIIWTWTARSAVAALAISKDAKTVLVGTADGGLSVLAIADDKPKLIGFANAHVSGVAAIAFNFDESRFASVGGDGIPKIWTLPANGTPALIHSLSPALPPSTPGPVALSAAAFSPDGRQLAVGGADRSVSIYDANTGIEIRSLRGCTDWVTALAFLPDGDHLLAVAADKAARIFDVSRNELLATNGHTQSAVAVAVRPDGQQFASVGKDRMIRLWDRRTGAEMAAIPCPAETAKFYNVCFAGPYLVTGGERSSLRLWNLAEKKEIASAMLGEIYGLAPSADGRRIGVWSRQRQQEHLCDLQSAQPHDARPFNHRTGSHYCFCSPSNLSRDSTGTRLVGTRAASSIRQLSAMISAVLFPAMTRDMPTSGISPISPPCPRCFESEKLPLAIWDSPRITGDSSWPSGSAASSRSSILKREK